MTKYFSITSEGDLMVAGKEIIKKVPGDDWRWRDKESSDLASLLWDVLKSLYPTDHRALEVAKSIFPGRFHCVGCGECCRHISQILPDFDTGNGVCMYLGPDNLCQIYEERPLVCRVDDYWAKCLRGKIRKEDWDSLNYQGCQALLSHPGRQGLNNT